MEKLQEIMEYINHINAHVYRGYDKKYLQEEMEYLEKEVYELVNSQQEEIEQLKIELILNKK